MKTIMQDAETVLLEHGEDDVASLLRKAAALLEENGRTLVSIVYGNSLDGDFREWIQVTSE